MSVVRVPQVGSDVYTQMKHGLSAKQEASLLAVLR